MKQLLNQIVNKMDTRQNLSDLRKLLKSEEGKQEFYPLFMEHIDSLCSCFSDEDAKTRKNAALLIGDMGTFLMDSTAKEVIPVIEKLVNTLYAAYENEQTLFVKSSYLQALKDYDYSHLTGQLQVRLNLLSDMDTDDTNRKHIQEEMRILSDLIIAVTGIKTHEFTGYDKSCECILLTNRLHREITESQVADTDALLKPFQAGVRFTTSHLADILPIRTYQELLFLIPGMTTLDADPVAAAQKVCNSYLLEFLQKRHTGTIPFYFRVELKSKLTPDQKTRFIRKFTSEIERLTDRQLVNTATNYELELRLIANKSGTYNTLLKLYTLKDDRFSYRIKHTPSSIKPVNAALLASLAGNYMKPKARVLDPFCGVGTMLIERQNLVKADTLYGVDIQADAIEKAKINTDAAGYIIHYINRDFGSFTHEYLFDEIFTDMPFAMGQTSKEDIYGIYKDFFAHAKTLLQKDGTIIMYSHDKDYVIRLVKEYNYTLIKQFVISEKENTHLFIIK